MQSTETQIKGSVKRSRVVALLLSLSLLLVLTACSSTGNNNGTVSNSPPAGKNTVGGNASASNEQIIKKGESLVIPTNNISSTAKFYAITVDGTRMEVVVVKAPDNTIRTAFNTCQVCNGSPKAYFVQIGSTLQCQNCGNKFPMSKVGVEAGGCNPVPILGKDKIVTDKSITIPYETLKTNTALFPSNWKKS